ncbi:CPBP family intramembrane glutamic endopeptidase [Halocatena halophila]|uniref:CPBP family intramembrane glutamic endopeptidase n=1 Tax=Halocatena halophila TaxID=2814576 RepID=UPI002ED48945
MVPELSIIVSQPRARGTAGALCVATGGFIAGLLGIVLLGVVLPAWIRETVAFRIAAQHQIQFGFALFGGALLYFHTRPDQLCRIRWPTFGDIAWIAVLPPLMVASGEFVTPMLSAVGLSPPSVGSTGAIDLASNPSFWPLAFVVKYLFAAPAEELLYRGIVQGLLRPAFDRLGIVLISGLLFGLLHLLVGIIQSGVGLESALYWGLSTTVPGVIWGYAYERTENLLVTIIAHAMAWTVPLGILTPFV